MVTLSDLLLKILMPIAGAGIGFAIGAAHFHLLGALAGLPMGFFLFAYLGLILDRMLVLIIAQSFHRRWASLSTSELRDQLNTSFTPNFILLELKRRGEDISRDALPLLGLLESDELNRRTSGWAALMSAFPDKAKLLRGYGYNPMKPSAECHDKLTELRNSIEMSATHHHA